jgi:ANTAR domain
MASTQSIRIEASSRPHAESLQATLDGYSSQLVREGKSWQVELEGEHLSTQLLELLRVLGTWLETERLESLRVHFDGRTYTVLVPSDARPTDSPTLLLERIAQLETALRSRIVIEQAKGILAARLGLEPEECFQILRREARSRRTNLHELAEQVIRSRSVPWQT